MKAQSALAFAIYLSILLLIALVAQRKKEGNATDFLLGGRNVNFWVTALSAHASDMSSWFFMAFPTSLYLIGFSQIWLAVALLIGMFLSWHYIAPQIRIATEKYNSVTLSSFFSSRFNDSRGIIRFITAALSLVFFTHYLAAGLISVGFLFESLFDLNYYAGTLIATLVIMAYTFIGGFVSVAWVDFFQAIFLLLVALIVPYVAWQHIEGWQSIISTAEHSGICLTIWPKDGYALVEDILFPLFGWGLGYFGMPHIITKFMGINNPQKLRHSKILGLTWMSLALSAAAMIGLIGIPFFKSGLENPEFMFLEMVKTLFSPLNAGFIFCGVFAATLSTMDSQLLVCASVIAEDLYKYHWNKKASHQQVLYASRCGIVFMSVTAFILSLNKDKSIMETVQYAWSGLGSTFGPLVLTALYSRTVNAKGAIAGVTAGGLISALWPTFNQWLYQSGWLHLTVPSMIPGFGCGIVMIFLVSQFTQPAPSDSSYS